MDDCEEKVELSFIDDYEKEEPSYMYDCEEKVEPTYVDDCEKVKPSSMNDCEEKVDDCEKEHENGELGSGLNPFGSNLVNSTSFLDATLALTNIANINKTKTSLPAIHHNQPT